MGLQSNLASGVLLYFMHSEPILPQLMNWILKWITNCQLQWPQSQNKQSQSHFSSNFCEKQCFHFFLTMQWSVSLSVLLLKAAFVRFCKFKFHGSVFELLIFFTLHFIVISEFWSFEVLKLHFSDHLKFIPSNGMKSTSFTFIPVPTFSFAKSNVFFCGGTGWVGGYHQEGSWYYDGRALNVMEAMYKHINSTFPVSQFPTI